MGNSGFHEGVVVIAEEQFKGRGQGNNSWKSAKGDNLLCSILFKPKCDLVYQFYFNQLIANSICQTLSDFGLDSEIKWPNDILIKNQKIAGILIENKIKGRVLESSIVGIGLNINQSKFDKELINPTSLKLQLQQKIDTELVLNKLMLQLEKNYFQFKRNELENIDKKYQSSLYRKDKETLFMINNEATLATIRAVNKQGEIVLEIDNVIQSFSNSEVKMIKE
jgi:BirA family biotin operon repressor/biotin-[acetyl-CoA-carboxylase] ligase